MARKKQAPAREQSHLTGPQHGDSPFGQEPDTFDHLGIENPLKKQSKADPVDKSAELLGKIEALTSTVEDLKSQNQRLMAAGPSYQAPVQQVAQVDPAKLKVDFTGLPDPLDNRAEYDRQLAERINAAIEGRTHAVREEVTREQTARQSREQLWNDFKTRHEAWADYPDLVATVAEQLVRKAQAQGIDPQRYMFVNSQGFHDDIAKELSAKYGRLVADQDDEGDEPTGRGDGTVEGVLRRGGPEQFDDAGRTSVLGGLEAGGRPSDRAQRGGKPPQTYDKDIQDVQRAMGLY